MREKISRKQEVFYKIYKNQKEKRQKFCLERSDLFILEQKQRQICQKLIKEKKYLQKIEQNQEY